MENYIFFSKNNYGIQTMEFSVFETAFDSKSFNFCLLSDLYTMRPVKGIFVLCNKSLYWKNGNVLFKSRSFKSTV